jgi:Putative restriction endonuclease
MTMTVELSEQTAERSPERVEIVPQEGVLVDPALLRPNLDHLVTEDGTAVDNLFSEKQMRLLTETLFTSWPGPGVGRPFVAMANVGLFYGLFQPPLVPDTLVSLDVRFPTELWAKHHRSYFTWEYGKPPDIVIEIVSNSIGDELGRKYDLYAQVGVLYYIVYDPDRHLKGELLRVFELERRSFRPREQAWFPEAGLGLRLWDGAYEGVEATWLRWCDEHRSVLLCGAERAIVERARADEERARADEERARAERLAAQLRALGVDPEKPD